MLSQYLQDATLNWMRGQPIDPPPAVLWMSFHSDTEATAAADVSYAFGGRVRIKQENLSEPRFLDGQSAGTRQIVNIAAAVSELASADASASSFAIWDSQVDGHRLISGTINPSAEIIKGNPVILLQGELSIRMT